MVEPSAVNRAVEDHLGLWWSKGTERSILHAFGPDVLTEVRRLYDFAVSQPVEMPGASAEQRRAQLQDCLERSFPFLSEISVRRLVNCFAYAWK